MPELKVRASEALLLVFSDREQGRAASEAKRLREQADAIETQSNVNHSAVLRSIFDAHDQKPPVTPITVERDETGRPIKLTWVKVPEPKKTVEEKIAEAIKPLVAKE